MSLTYTKWAMHIIAGTIYVGVVLKTCLQHLIGIPFPVDLAALARVEDHTAKSFDAPTFYSLGNGTFLQFVAAQPKAIEALGGQCIVSTMETQLSLQIKQTLIRLISQLKDKKKVSTLYMVLFSQIFYAILFLIRSVL